jgi:2-iminobutanoate/2-iminopropanoate deaminase
MKDIVRSSRAPQPIGPYSQAVKANGLVFVSGQIALDAKTGAIIQDTIEAEAKQVMENLHYILTDAGTSFNNVLKCTIFVTDLANWDVINKVYGSYFDGLAPARETVQVVALPKGAQVEISCIASGGY